MVEKQYSHYQQKVIKHYYDNKDALMLQKLQELVTELYLAKNTKKEDKLWERVEKALYNLKVKRELNEHIMRKRSAELLAKHVADWLKTAR